MPIPTKIPLILAPTPCHRLDKMSDQLGIDLWIKRDDLTGFALGGNKGRKLEYLIAEALAMRAEVVVTCGSAQSNFIRQLGAACSRFGIVCAAAAMLLPYEHEKPTVAGAARPSSGSTGNVLLDEILGVDLHLYPDGTWDELYAHAESLALEFESQGRNVYRIPVGGSSPLGAYAFVEAAQELGYPFDWIITASSSGSTHTGLAYAFAGTATRVVGVACDNEPDIAEDFAKISKGLDDLLGATGVTLEAADYDLRFEYVGPGYGSPSEAGNEAIRTLARAEGIFLDPIYSGKAFAGLIDLAREGKLSGRVLFWHTGGIPALFA